MERHMARFMEAAKSIQTAEGTKEAITLLQQNSTDIAPIAGYPGFVLARTEQAIDSLLFIDHFTGEDGKDYLIYQQMSAEKK
jgi:hypothetical protein